MRRNLLPIAAAVSAVMAAALATGYVWKGDIGYLHQRVGPLIDSSAAFVAVHGGQVDLDCGWVTTTTKQEKPGPTGPRFDFDRGDPLRWRTAAWGCSYHRDVLRYQVVGGVEYHLLTPIWPWLLACGVAPALWWRSRRRRAAAGGFEVIVWGTVP